MKMQFFTCYTLSENVDGLSVWILPICRNIGADKPKGHCVKLFVSTRQLSTFTLHGCPKSKSTPGFVASFLHMFVNLCCYVQYIYTTTHPHSDFSLLFCYDNAVIIVF